MSIFQYWALKFGEKKLKKLCHLILVGSIISKKSKKNQKKTKKRKNFDIKQLFVIIYICKKMMTMMTQKVALNSIANFACIIVTT
tara:strand:+ start:29 stop:283 length:255 start_codon:yes stop_codon:yes gene_type:complete